MNDAGFIIQRERMQGIRLCASQELDEMLFDLKDMRIEGDIKHY